ncbi:MAG: DUF3565 domain-containing protein [Gemmatimonadales bacterium]|nr:DUF3565 domain-containing protein [Gemmatimonadales bacterium]
MKHIVGFHQDERGEWIAELECGHARHIRHEPPWRSSDWVTTPAGRAGRLGTELRCLRCHP